MLAENFVNCLARIKWTISNGSKRRAESRRLKLSLRSSRPRRATRLFCSAHYCSARLGLAQLSTRAGPFSPCVWGVITVAPQREAAAGEAQPIWSSQVVAESSSSECACASRDSSLWSAHYRHSPIRHTAWPTAVLLGEVGSRVRPESVRNSGARHRGRVPLLASLSGHNKPVGRLTRTLRRRRPLPSI